MKFSISLNSLACAGLLCLAMLPANAHNDLAEGTAAPLSSASRQLAPSITSHLQMRAGQIEQLNRLFDAYATHRSEQEANLARWQNQLDQMPTPTADPGQASHLRRDINEAQQQVTTDFLTTRDKALKTLLPVQRAQLAALATDPRIKVRGDQYYELLLLPVEQLGQFPMSREFEESRLTSRPRRQPRHRSSANYDIYGGYSQGQPQYGVYGSYGQGSTGVQVGVGRGGPSIGISVGGIFGGWHRH